MKLLLVEKSWNWNSWNSWVLPPIHNVMRWLLAFSMRNTIQAINFVRKVKYNLLNETIWRIFLVICFIYICVAYSGYMPWVWRQCLCAIIMLIRFLHLYIETQVSQTFVNSSKTLLYYGGTFKVFRGPIWGQIFRGNKAWFLAKRTIALLSCFLYHTPIAILEAVVLSLVKSELVLKCCSPSIVLTPCRCV